MTSTKTIPKAPSVTLTATAEQPVPSDPQTVRILALAEAIRTHQDDDVTDVPTIVKTAKSFASFISGGDK